MRKVMVREEEGMKRKKEGRKLITLRRFAFLPHTCKSLAPFQSVLLLLLIC